MAIAATSVLAQEPMAPPDSRVDAQGDPLPDGVTARLGPLRYQSRGGWFLADSQTLLSSHGQGLTWLDVTTGKVTRSVELGPGSVTLMAITPDRSLAAVRIYDFQGENQRTEHQMVIVDTTTGEIRSRLPRRPTDTHTAPVCAALTPDGTHLAVGERDGKGRVRIVNLATGREETVRVSPAFDRFPREKNEGIQSLAFSPDGKWLVVASTLDVARWQWQRNEPMEQMGTLGKSERSVNRILLARLCWRI